MSEFVIKICLLGDAGVGKTSLVYRFIENRFSRDFKSTLGVNLLKKNVKINDDDVSAQIWDLGGQQAYKKLRKLYLEGAQGALMVFDVTSQTSFDNLEDWKNSLLEVRGEVPFILIGNKIDLEANQVISEKQAKAFANSIDVPLLLTSAKTGESVEEAFKELIGLIVDEMKERDE